MAPRFVARQLSWPTGFGGFLIRKLMNRGNAALNAYAIEQLGLTPTDHVLEVGFGGGVALPSLLARSALVCGVDRSEDAVKAAEHRFARAVNEGRAAFRLGTVEALRLADASFDKALTVNTVYFWLSLDNGLAELRRVLKPGGRLVVGFLPRSRMDRMNMPADIFTPRQPDDVLAAMRAAGLASPELRAPTSERGWVVATAVR